MIYVALAPAFGLVRRHTSVPFVVATVVFVEGVFGGVLVGLAYPLTLVAEGGSTLLPTVISANVSAWLAVLLLYAFAASVLPVWTLLQPRDYLSSFLLYAGLGGAVLAIVVGTANTSLAMNLDPFTRFMSPAFDGMGPLVPMLVPTIFCGGSAGSTRWSVVGRPRSRSTRRPMRPQSATAPRSPRACSPSPSGPSR